MITSKMYDSSYNIITERISSFLPRMDTNKVVNRLLSGQFHYQTIGSAVKMIDVTFYVDEDSKETLDRHEAINAPVELHKEGKYYQGLITAPPKWKIHFDGNRKRRRYLGQITISVTEEGVV